MQRIIDGHSFEEISEGFYSALEPYIINIQDWMFEENHANFEAITKTTNDSQTAFILYISTGRGANALQEKLEKLRLTDKTVGYIGCPQAFPSSVGGIFYEDCDV